MKKYHWHKHKENTLKEKQLAINGSSQILPPAIEVSSASLVMLNIVNA